MMKFRMIVIAAYALVGAHPGPVFGWPDARKSENAASKLEGGEPTSEPLWYPARDTLMEFRICIA